MAVYETIKYEKEAGFCVITLNRPKSLNALNVKMWGELNSALDDIDNDDEIKAFIFTGTPRPDGKPCFCAGADLKEMAGFISGGVLPESADGAPANVTLTKPSGTKNFWALRQPKPTIVPTFEKITWSPKISIAAIDGVCTAGGTEMALACDLVVASETAQISDMHVKNLGWIGGAGGTANMAWRVGVSKAIELCCTGDVIDGKEAHRIGFANQVWPSDQYLEKTKELARKIGGMRLAAVIMTKATIQSVQDMDRKSTLRYCDDGFSILLSEQGTADFGPQRWVDQR
ncbi:MAG: enoyl-CoA hydratase/isomerase family protein [Dehalococcoidia bacterium]|nr:enoyl-CoA hydratase/isomerase family protein [Dehalococcoidia bacterium]